MSTLFFLKNLSFLSALLQFYSCLASDEILLTNIIFRHGDRSPITGFPNDFYNESSWPQGYGQLSVKGMQQQKELGEFLRHRYESLLDERYLRKEIYVRSTDYDRTLMSAYSVLAGLYPPKGNQTFDSEIQWQPIPVHTVPKLQDKLLAQKAECPALTALINEGLQSETYKNLTNEIQEFLTIVANFPGQTNLTLDTLWATYDTLLCQKRHDYVLPEWATDEVMSRMRHELIPPLMEIKFNRGAKMSRLRQGVLLGKMVQDMVLKKDGELPDSKAFIYSAHDNTIASLLSSLQVFNHMVVPYSACIMVELHYIDNHNYTVLVSYRNDSTHEPYPMQLPGCTVQCPLDQFIEITKNYTSDEATRDMECLDTALHDIVKKMLYVAIISVVGGVLLILCLVAVSVCYHKRRVRKRRMLHAANTYNKLRSSADGLQPESVPMMYNSSDALSDEEL